MSETSPPVPAVDGPADGEVGLSRWSGLAATAAFVYVVVWMARASLLSFSGERFREVSEQSGNVVARLGLGLLVLGILYHLLDGLRLVAEEGSPAMRARSEQLRSAVGFVTFAVGLPVATIILQPWIATQV